MENKLKPGQIVKAEYEPQYKRKSPKITEYYKILKYVGNNYYDIIVLKTNDPSSWRGDLSSFQMGIHAKRSITVLGGNGFIKALIRWKGLNS